jgi:hypothetical protein
MALFFSEQGDNLSGMLEAAGLMDSEDIYIVQFKDVYGKKWDALFREGAKVTVRLGCDVFVIDTFSAFADLQDTEEDSSGPIGQRMRLLSKLAQEYNIAIVVVRHAGKDGKGRGSSAFEDVPDICLTLGFPEGNHAPNVRSLKCVGRFGIWEENIALKDNRYVSLGRRSDMKMAEALEHIKAVLPRSAEAGGECNQKAVVERVKARNPDLSKSTISRALDDLVSSGDVEWRELSDRQGKPKIYWLSRETGEGEGAEGDADRDADEGGEKVEEKREDVSLNQTLSYTLYDDSNKHGGETEGENRPAPAETESEQESPSEGDVVGDGDAEHPSTSLAHTGEQVSPEGGEVADELERVFALSAKSDEHDPLDCECQRCSTKTRTYATPRSAQ